MTGTMSANQNTVIPRTCGFDTKRLELESSVISELSDELSQNNNLILRLPAELRNRIYEDVLGGMTIRQTRVNRRSCDRTRMAFLPSKDKHPNPETWLALTQVCRQIRDETKLIPWATSIISFSRLARIRYLLKQLRPEQRTAIRSIQFEIYDTFAPLQMFMANPAMERIRPVSSGLRLADLLPGVDRVVVLILQASDVKTMLYIEIPRAHDNYQNSQFLTEHFREYLRVSNREWWNRFISYVYKHGTKVDLHASSFEPCDIESEPKREPKPGPELFV